VHGASSRRMSPCWRRRPDHGAARPGRVRQAIRLACSATAQEGSKGFDAPHVSIRVFNP
jgi:hypothetical protein